MCDGYDYLLHAFYWRGDGNTMFSPILEVTTIQDGGALAKKVYTWLAHDVISDDLQKKWKEGAPLLSGSSFVPPGFAQASLFSSQKIIED